MEVQPQVHSGMPSAVGTPPSSEEAAVELEPAADAEGEVIAAGGPESAASDDSSSSSSSSSSDGVLADPVAEPPVSVAPEPVTPAPSGGGGSDRPPVVVLGAPAPLPPIAHFEESAPAVAAAPARLEAHPTLALALEGAPEVTSDPVHEAEPGPAGADFLVQRPRPQPGKISFKVQGFAGFQGAKSCREVEEAVAAARAKKLNTRDAGVQTVRDPEADGDYVAIWRLRPRGMESFPHFPRNAKRRASAAPPSSAGPVVSVQVA